MNTLIYIAVGVGLLALLLAAISQVLLKAAANQTYDTRLREYLNPRVITAYGLMVLSALCTMYALRYLSVASITMIQSGGYIVIPVLGFFVFRERITTKQLLGMALILSGLIVFAL